MNRGLAVLGDALYHAPTMAHLLALDARSGTLRWDVASRTPSIGHSMTAAPLAVKDKIIVGISGGEFGIRGYLDAYDAEDGRSAPGGCGPCPAPGEPGHETWEGDELEDGRRRHVGDGHVRPAAEPALLGHGQSRARLQRRRSRGRQPLLEFAARDRRRSPAS